MTLMNFKQAEIDMEQIKDFLILHYVANNREGALLGLCPRRWLFRVISNRSIKNRADIQT